MPFVKSGQSAGTTGKGKRLEGIRIRLTGDLAKHYDVRYSTHIQTYGDAQGWVYNGGLAGTTGEAKRLEEIKVQIIPKNSLKESPSVTYRVHRQTYGWENVWSRNGAVSGTTGQAKRLEGIEIRISDNKYSGGVQYKTHVQSYGWLNWAYNGEMSGTQGEAKRLEAIQIALTGDIANEYDIYYRVHAQHFGWMGWAKNGESAGTASYGYRLEAIQIKLVKKNGAAPKNDGNTATKYEDKDQPKKDDNQDKKEPEKKDPDKKEEPKPSENKTEVPEEELLRFGYYVCGGYDKTYISEDGSVLPLPGAKECNKKFYVEEYYIWKYGYYDENDPNMNMTAHALYEDDNNKNFSHGCWHESGYDYFTKDGKWVKSSYY